MTRLPAPTTIGVTCTAAHQPKSLIWGRQHFVVDRIPDTWQVETDWWTANQHVSRHYFTVTTTAGAVLVIYYDFLTAQWVLEQAYD